tara:strand:+ start:82336 stop:83853 length:1518 start_codon:yes stop_codon:yes gene_type:complete
VQTQIPSANATEQDFVLSTHLPERGRHRFSRTTIPFVGAATALLVSLFIGLVFAEIFSPKMIFLLMVPVVAFIVILRGFFGALGIGLIAAATAFILIGALLFFQPVGGIGAGAFLLFCGGVAFVADRYHRSRQETARLHERQQAILDSVPAAVFLFDVSGKVHFFSAAAEAMFGWRAEEIRDRPVWLLFPPQARVVIETCLASAARDGEHDGFGRPRITLGQKKDESTFEVELSVSPRRSNQEKLLTGFCRNLSDELAAQHKLTALQSQLIHMSRLTAMGQMASALAHELNQPLIAISNYVSASARLMQQHPQDPLLVGDALRGAAEQARRAGRIISGLRDFVAKNESRRRECNVESLVDEAVVLATVGAAEGWLDVDIEPDLVSVFIDPIQIQQVLVNLIRNAIEAMEEVDCRQKLEIVARRVGGFIEVKITDNGPGIAPEVVDRLLQPFVSTKTAGLGIGLSISRDIVEAHGGKIWLDPAPGPGATFRFTLPVFGGGDAAVAA